MILGTIGAIVTAVTGVVKTLGIVNLALQGMKALGNIFTSLGKALGLIKPETEVEELGDKVIQSEYNPEDYRCYADYIKAVENYDLDPEKSKLTTSEEKLAKGIEAAVGSVIEEFQNFQIAEFCIAVGENPTYFSEAKMGEIAKLMKTDGGNISSILDFVNGTEKNNTKIQSAVDMLMSVEKAVNPAIGDKDAFKNIMQVRK